MAGWNFIISLVAVTGGEALAFSYYFKTLCLAFGWQIPLSDVAVALIVTIVFIIANVFGVRLTGRLQTAEFCKVAGIHRKGQRLYVYRRRVHDLVVLCRL